MTLILSAQSSSHYPHSDILRHEFDQQGGTIGRARNNTWVLPDDQKHLSGQHARIDFISGQYLITDISTNGIFVNGEEKPLGPNNRIPLQDGDVLRMGWYDVTVKLPQAEVPSAHIDESPNEHPLADVATCIVGSPSSLTPSPTSPPQPSADIPAWDHDITPLSQTPATHRQAEDINWDDDEWWQSNASTPAPAPAPAPSPQTSTANKTDDKIDHDKLFDDDEWWKNDNNDSLENKQNIDHNTPKESAQDEAQAEKIPSATVEQSNNHHEAFDDNLDLDNDNWWESPSNNPSDNANPNNANLNNASKPTPAVDATQLHTEHNTANPQPQAPLKQLAETPTANPPQTPNVTSDESIAQRETPATQVKPVAAITPAPKQVATPVAAITEEQIHQAAVHAFLQGLGIKDEDLQQRISRDLDFEKVGYLFRNSVQGTLDLLYARANIKNEMRMEMTTIQPIENNPLKFAIHVDDALCDLLTKQNKNHLPAEQALNEAYDDIRAHQIAVISGVQASINELLARFEPEKLSKRLQKQNSIAASMPWLRKAKLWTLFEELHETIQQEAQDDFSRLFGAAFAKAYDQQVKVLKQNAKNEAQQK